eukprot:4130399-Alexandrium_andersonii.AAC.1
MPQGPQAPRPRCRNAPEVPWVAHLSLYSPLQGAVAPRSRPLESRRSHRSLLQSHPEPSQARPRVAQLRLWGDTRQ